MRALRLLALSCLLAMTACSTSTVTMTTVKLYKGGPLPEAETARVHGIAGLFGKGIATAVCGVDGRVFDPCVTDVELLPGEHTIDVRLILGNSYVYRSWTIDLVRGGDYNVRPARIGDTHYEEPVIRFHRDQSGNKVRDRASAARKAEPAVAQREIAAQAARRFLDQGGGVIRDSQTGLEWRRSDNGSDIHWNDARAYCQRLVGGWMLPTVVELQGIYDKSGLLRTRCGKDTCKASPLFRLTGPTVWSSEQDGPSRAWIVVLVIEHSFTYGIIGGSTFGLRALCVRRPVHGAG